MIKKQHKFSERWKLAFLEEWQDEYNFKTFALQLLCLKYECSQSVAWIWKRKFLAGESLQNKSPIPHTFPSKTPQSKIDIIANIKKEHPEYSPMQIFTECADDFNLDLHYQTVVKYDRLLDLPKLDPINTNTKPYTNPIMLGTKWQMDVKFVPHECFVGYLLDVHTIYSKKKLYQYTIMDMSTNKVFRYAYNEHSAERTVDFIQKAISYFGYLPKKIQTDNGFEFTNPNKKRQDKGTVHQVDQLLKKLGIEHKLIPPVKPQHNGKVERVHGLDQSRFYNFRKFNDLEDLNNQLMEYNEKHNKTRTRVLRNRKGRMVYFSPNQKEQELLDLLTEQNLSNTGKITITYAVRKGTTAKHTYIEKNVKL